VFVSSFGRNGAVLQSYGRILAMASSDPKPGGDRDVFSGLPNARPQRRSAKRDRPGKGAKAAEKGSAAPSTRSAARPSSSSARSTGSAARPAARRKAPPQARAAATTKPAAAASASPRATPKQTPPVPPAGYATPVDDERPRGTDLVGTAVQAAGELAQIGIAAGGRALKSALERLPRP
jgi:hypothetical protein